MVELLKSYGLTSSESVILIVSIVTFSITTGLKILFNYLENKQNRISREREWKFKVYYEFFNDIDSNINILTKKINEYVTLAINNLAAIMNDPDMNQDNFTEQALQFTNNLTEFMGEIDKSKERVSLFAGKKSNEALGRYVESINSFWNKSIHWFSNMNYHDILNNDLNVIITDFNKYMNTNFSELMNIKGECYTAIRKELGLGSN